MKILNAMVVGLCAFAGSAAAQCSNASLRGAYAYTVDGVATVDGNAVTNSDVGRIVFDGAGRYTVKAAFTVNGETTVGEGAGTYGIGADCTMTGKGEGIEFDGVVVGGGSDFAVVIREPGLTRSGSGTKIEGQACSAGAIAGSYGYSGEGALTVEGRVITLSEVGILSFSGNQVTGVYSASGLGVVERRQFSGAFAINADCTATAEFKAGDASYVMNFVVASQGNAIYYSTSGGGVTVTGTAARVSPR